MTANDFELVNESTSIDDIEEELNQYILAKLKALTTLGLDYRNQIESLKCCGNCQYECKTEDEHIENCIPCENRSNWKRKEK